MNGSTEHRASGASEESPGRRYPVLNLATTRRMLPLVRQVVADLRQSHQRLRQVRPECEHLDRNRRALTWPLRQRRYQLRDEIAALEKSLVDALTELEGLQVALLDLEAGRVGFPTAVNGQQAFFSWSPAEDTIDSWHFAGETNRRPIPPRWVREADLQMSAKS
jgi:hypothetical protein